MRRTERPIQTRFRCAYAYRLKLARHMKSLTHYTKGTPSPRAGAPTACRLSISGSISPPSSGCFSPFPHGTGSLSVAEEYLGLEGGPPTFRQNFTCSALLKDTSIALPVRGYHPLRPCFPDRFRLSLMYHWPGPRSLATTNGVSVDVLSSRYLDVSVPWVRLKPPILFGSLIPSLDNWKSKTSSSSGQRHGSQTLLSEPQN